MNTTTINIMGDMTAMEQWRLWNGTIKQVITSNVRGIQCCMDCIADDSEESEQVFEACNNIENVITIWCEELKRLFESLED